MKKPTIFISHASKDGKIATSIRDMITASSSLAPDDIRCTSAAGSQLAGNVDFDAKLKEEIQNAKLCIFLVSKYFLSSEYCKKRNDMGRRHQGYMCYFHDGRVTLQRNYSDYWQ